MSLYDSSVERLDSAVDQWIAAADRYLALVDKARRPQPGWRKLDRLAAKFEPEFRRAFLAAVRAAGDGIVLAPIVRALEAGDIAGAIASLPIDEMQATLHQGITDSLREVYDRAGQVTTTMLPSGREAFAFDVISTRGLAILEEHAAELVTQVSASTREAIRAAIVTAREAGMSAQDAARLVKPVIGLTDRFAEAVLRRGASLALQGFSDAAVQRELANYADRLRQHRAMMIARTEPRFAVSAARMEAWNQAVDLGLFERGQLKRRWITVEAVHDENDPCPRLDGQTVGIDELYTDPETGEQYDSPPDPHPHCTCQEELVYDG